jgi:hypothetical protein
MKNKLWLIIGVMISLIMISSFASAACRIAFYTLDEDKNLIKADLSYGICKNSNERKIIKYQAGGLYSFGGPLATCADLCDKVKINASIYDQGKLIMFGEKELSGGNVNNWNSTDTIFFNLTLKYVDTDAKNSGSGSSHLVKPEDMNPSNLQILNNSNKIPGGSNSPGEKDNSKHLNIPNDSSGQSIIKDWMIYGIIGFVLILGILAFLFFNKRTKEMGGKI